MGWRRQRGWGGVAINNIFQPEKKDLNNENFDQKELFLFIFDESSEQGYRALRFFENE